MVLFHYFIFSLLNSFQSQVKYIHNLEVTSSFILEIQLQWLYHNYDVYDE